MNRIITREFRAKDEHGKEYCLTETRTFRSIEASKPAADIEGWPKLTTENGVPLKHISKGVYELLIFQAPPIKLTTDDPEAP